VVSVLEIVLVLSLLSLIRRVVLGPLAEVERYAAAVSAGDRRGITLQGRRFSSELAGVSASIERMVLLLDQRYAAMVESENRYRALFNGTSDAIFVRPGVEGGAPSTYVEVNDSACRRLGYSREELLRMTPLDIGAGGSVLAIGNTVLEKGSVNVESTYRTKDGKEIAVELTGRKIELDGRPMILMVARDITERRSLEEQLRRAQKMEAIGLLAAGVAHDFNNILAVVLATASLLKMGRPASDSSVADIDELIAAAERGAKLTRGLLMFGRRPSVSSAPVDLAAVATNLDGFLRRIIGEDIEFVTRLPPTPLLVRVAADQLEQVLANLVTNSRDAMPSGGRLVVEVNRIDVGEEESQLRGFPGPGAFASLSVSDTGSGMDKAMQHRIFEPFFTTKEVGKGSGLGLAIVYGVAKHHGGTIEVVSEVGRGTSISAHFPLCQDPQAAPVKPARPTSAPSGTETVLLAEDDAPVRHALATLLARFGYEVILAVNGADAVDQFRSHQDRIRLVVMDVVMPVMNGKEAYEAMKQSCPDVRVLFISGYADDVVERHGGLGSDLLMKPAAPFDFLSKVRAMIAIPRYPSRIGIACPQVSSVGPTIERGAHAQAKDPGESP
jgi:PAS domain S-box-containing protein